MSRKLIEKTAEYVKLKLYNEPTGHDWYHVERVWKMAKRLQKEEGGDLELVEMAALVHDLANYKRDQMDDEKDMLILNGMLDILGVETPMKRKINRIVEEIQYHGDETRHASTIEAKILQDANWLDALGALGVARTFATGGFIKRPIYDPDRRVRRRMTKETYRRRKTEGSSINNFYEKILKLPKFMNTKTARALAEKRVAFVGEFIEEFMREWSGEDWP